MQRGSITKYVSSGNVMLLTGGTKSVLPQCSVHNAHVLYSLVIQKLLMQDSHMSKLTRLVYLQLVWWLC